MNLLGPLFLGTTFLVISFGVFIGIYLFMAWVHSRIGNKLGVGSFGEFCIPIYNMVLLCRCAGMSGWNVLWLLLPVANLIFLVYMWGSIAERLGHNFWAYGLGIFLFGLPIFILSFDSSTAVGLRGNYRAPDAPSVYCISGEYAGNRMYIEGDGLVIGRSPSQAHLVLSNPEVSGAHVRIWPDHSGIGVWVQDMQSANGTYYSAAGNPGEPPRWLEVSQPTLLTSGTRVRLGDGVAEFVVS